MASPAMMIVAVIVVVSGALLLGAAWGAWRPPGKRTEGFMLALAGGALLVAAVAELVQPAIEKSSILTALGGVALGAAVFTGIDWWIDEHWGPQSGGGLLAAIALDGIPENLALGVALIGAGAGEVAALAASIFLSNLPEAAGSAREMIDDGRSRGRVLAIWATVALVLSAAALLGNVAMQGASDHALALVRSFAAGAVVASLATEIFPKAYGKDNHMAGVATALGVMLALILGEMTA
jgi:ZIP family zinc transporter